MPEWEEGFGITVAEALAAGCLCVCAAKGGIPEIIRDGIDGILVQSASADELEDILLGVIPEYLSGNCRQMQDRAVSRSCEFTIQNYAKKFDQYLEQKQSRQQH
jgi:glycosyltransferase involved in cell wall biosynthesis